MTTLERLKEVVGQKVEMLLAAEDPLRSAAALITDSGIEVEDHDLVVDLLAKVAAQGSIDAVALMVALGAPERLTAQALADLVRRSPDLVEEVRVNELTRMLEEFAEEEIAAGRMTKTKDPKTGRWLYQTRDP